MATFEKVLKFKIQGIETEVRNIDELREALKKLETELEGTDFGADNFEALQAQVAAARGEMINLERDVEALNPARQTEAFVKLGEAIVGAFAIGSVLEEFGGDSKTILELQAKAERALVAIQGARAIAEGVLELATIKRVIAQKIATVQTWLQNAATRAGTVSENASTAAKITATIAQRALNFAAAAFPYALVVAGLAAIVAAMVLYSRRTKELTKEQKEFKAVQEEIAKQREADGKKVTEEIGKMKARFAIAKSLTVTDSERRDAIRRINEEYGEYLPNLLTEKSTLEDITKAEKEATKAMAARMILAQREEQIGKEIQLQLDIQKEVNKEIDALIGKRGLSMQDLRGNVEEVGDAWDEMFKGSKDVLKTQTTDLEGLRRELELLIDPKFANSGDLYNTGGSVKQRIDRIIKAKEVQIQAENEIQKIIKESNQLAEQFGATIEDGTKNFNDQRDAANQTRLNILELLRQQEAAEFELAKVRADQTEALKAEIGLLKLESDRRLKVLEDELSDALKIHAQGSEARKIVEKTFATKKLTIEEEFQNDRSAIEKKYADKASEFIRKKLEEERELREKLLDLDQKIFEEGIKFLELEKDLKLAQHLEIIDKKEAAQIKALENEKKTILENEKLTAEERIKQIQLFEAKRANIEKDAQKKRDEAEKEEKEKRQKNNEDIFNSITDSAQKIVASTIQVLSTLIAAQIKAVDEQIAKADEAIQRLAERAEESKARINTIEEELKTAQGQRREYLIKLLENERKKEEQILDAKRKEEGERAEMAKKRLALERQQQKLEAISIGISTALAAVQAAIAISKAAAGGKLGFDNIAYAIAATAALVAGFVAVRNAVKMEDGGLIPAGSAFGMVDRMYGGFAGGRYADGGMLRGPLHSQGGIRGTGTLGHIEAEGGEFVNNRKSSARNRAVLEAINNDRGNSSFKLIRMAGGGSIALQAQVRRMAEGGALPNIDAIEAGQLATEGIVSAIRQLSKENQDAISKMSPEVSVVEIVKETANYVKIQDGAKVTK
jgi:hypothetical protein